MRFLDYEPCNILYFGFADALRLHRCALLLLQSRMLRWRTLQCFFLNGIIFLGSILLYNHVVSPFLRFLFARSLFALGVLTHESQEAYLDACFNFFKILYHVLWIYPIYCISFILNTVMYQDLADEAFSISKRSVSDKPRRSVSALRRIVDEMFRVILNMLYIIWMHCLYLVPIFGPLLYFVHICWLASLYAFEYRWVSLKWNTSERMQYFEKHWLYFLGFGLPVSLLCLLCPRFVDTGVFAILFPFFIFTSTMAQPKPITQRSRLWPSRIPIFLVVESAGRVVIRIAEELTLRGHPRS